MGWVWYSSLYPAQEKFWTGTGCLAKDLGTSRTGELPEGGKPGEVGT